MRLKIWDRVFGAVSGLIILAIGVGLFVFGSGVFPFRLDTSFLDQSFQLWQRVVMVAVAVALFLLGIRGLMMLFRSNRERGFILQHTEYGDLSIATTAMENMVKKCVDTHEELKVSTTRISHARDGIVVSIRIALASGVNIPITVSALQKQIKQYITSCSGVDVKEVRVMVETNNNLAARFVPKPTDSQTSETDIADRALPDGSSDCAPAVQPQGAAKEATAAKPLHQRLFHKEDKPHIVPQPPSPMAAAPAPADESPAASQESAEANPTPDPEPTKEEEV